MDATCASYMARVSVALENIVAIGGLLDVFAGNLYQFLSDVSGGLTDATHVMLRMEGVMAALKDVVAVRGNLDAFAIKP